MDVDPVLLAEREENEDVDADEQVSRMLIVIMHYDVSVMIVNLSRHLRPFVPLSKRSSLPFALLPFLRTYFNQARELGAYERAYEDEHSWEMLQEDEQGRLMPLSILAQQRAKRKRLLEAFKASARTHSPFYLHPQPSNNPIQLLIVYSIKILTPIGVTCPAWRDPVPPACGRLDPRRRRRRHPPLPRRRHLPHARAIRKRILRPESAQPDGGGRALRGDRGPGLGNLGLAGSPYPGP